MKFIIIGLGSMGKRRLRLLREYEKKEGNEDSYEICGVDNRFDRRDEVEKQFGIKTEESLEKALLYFNADAVFVCTSPISHANIISECLKNNKHVFAEINVIADGYEKNIQLAKRQGLVLYLSSTPMKRREIQYITNWIRENNYKVTYQYHVGQYLPDWHPWENYKDFFVNDKRTNGCRELFSIELPWMAEAFGEVVKFSSQHTKLSKLNINYDDTYQVMLEHSTGIIGCLMIDVVTPKAGRQLEIFGEGIYLSWRGTPDTLMVMENGLKDICLYDGVSHEKGYEKFIIEDAYYEEIKEFMNCIQLGYGGTYSFEQDEEILRIIDGIEE